MKEGNDGRPTTGEKSPLIRSILEKLRVFEKQRRRFFSTSRRRQGNRRTNDGDDRRPSTAKKSRPLILPKILNFRKIASFWKTGKIWFFSQVRPCDERGKWGTTRRSTRLTTTTDDDRWPTAKKSRPLILLKIDFRLRVFDSDDLIFFNDRRGKWRTTTTTDERKNLVHSFYQKSWILERLRVFEKLRKFDFFHRSVLVTKEGNDGRPTTATTVDGEKISHTHFAKNLEF